MAEGGLFFFSDLGSDRKGGRFKGRTLIVHRGCFVFFSGISVHGAGDDACGFEGGF